MNEVADVIQGHENHHGAAKRVNRLDTPRGCGRQMSHRALRKKNEFADIAYAGSSSLSTHWTDWTSTHGAKRKPSRNARNRERNGSGIGSSLKSVTS